VITSWDPDAECREIIETDEEMDDPMITVELVKCVSDC